MSDVAYTVDLPDGRSVESFTAAAEAGYPFACEWFALCENPADVALPHPVLTAVPTCNRCAARYAAAQKED